MQKQQKIYFNYQSKVFYPSYIRNSHVVAKPHDTDDSYVYQKYGPENKADMNNRNFYGYVINSYLLDS